MSGWMFLLVLAHPGSPGQRAVKRSCVCDYIAVTKDMVRGCAERLPSMWIEQG